jgi:hypothetical protein
MGRHRECSSREAPAVECFGFYRSIHLLPPWRYAPHLKRLRQSRDAKARDDPRDTRFDARARDARFDTFSFTYDAQIDVMGRGWC